jgi:hypothetical protein
VNWCWSVFQWGLILAFFIGLAVVGYLYYYLDDEIARQVENRLARHYHWLNVDLRRARFDPSRGIGIFGLEIAEPITNPRRRALVSIKELHLIGDLRMEDLLAGAPVIERIVVRGATLQALRGTDGRWNISTLLPLPRFSAHSPEIAIEDSTVTLEDTAPTGGARITLKMVNVTLVPIAPDGPDATGGHFRVAGTVTGLPASEVRFEGRVGSQDRSINLTVRVSGLDISPELVASLPGFHVREPNGLDVSGLADATLQIQRSAHDSQFQWSATASIDRGRLAHKDLPEPLTDVAVSATADSDRLKIQLLTGKFGPANVTLACTRAGWATNAPVALSARVTGLSLDDRLKSALPGKLARICQRFRPTGLVDVQLQLTFDGNRWRPQLTANCRNVSLTDMEKFPYPLEQATGLLKYTPAGSAEPDRLQIDLTAMGSGRPIRIQADLTDVASADAQRKSAVSGLAGADGEQRPHRRAAGYRAIASRQADTSPPQHPVGRVEISGQDIPLHEQLVAALPEKGETLVRSLRSRGTIDFRFLSEWKSRTQSRADVSLDILLKDCTLRYEKFPYPLDHVNGALAARNWNWTFDGIKGQAGSGAAVLLRQGRAIPRGAGYSVDLGFEASNVPLDDNLRHALPPRIQKCWVELQPQGRLDVSARVSHESNPPSGQAAPTIDVTMQPRERSVSIQPLKFPYRFEQVDGIARFAAGRVELANLRARHGRVEYAAASGAWQPMQDGGWQLDFNGVDAYRLAPQRDRDLAVALPPSLQAILQRLQPTGTYDIHNSRLSLTKSPQSERLAAAWDVHLECYQAAIPGGLPMQSMSGGIRLTGRNDGQSPYNLCELDLDSVVWKDVQITNVRGPLWIDRSFCLAGTPASTKLRQPPRRIRANAYGGTVTVDAALQHDTLPRYTLDVLVDGVSLARFANERLGGLQDLSGTVSGKLSLSGMGKSPQTLSGNGELHVVDANIYQLPVLVRLLKVLRNRTPTPPAFNRCDMQFAVHGEYIRFQQLNLLGDAMSLYGEGETNFDRELDLVFHTLIGPADLPIPLWKTIAGQVSQQGLQINVAGRWDNPQVESEPLPAVNEVLQQIQAGAATMAPSTAVRDALAPTR